MYIADISQSVDMVLAFNLHKATITSNLNSQITNYCQLVKVKGILFNVGGQTGKDCLFTWADGVKVADRRD